MKAPDWLIRKHEISGHITERSKEIQSSRYKRGLIKKLLEGILLFLEKKHTVMFNYFTSNAILSLLTNVCSFPVPHFREKLSL